MIKRSTLAFSSITAWSVEDVFDEVTSAACGWRWPTGADQGRVTVSHPRGSASVVGAGGAVPPWASIDNWHSCRSRTVACADAGAANISARTAVIPANVNLIIGRLRRYAHHERFRKNRLTLWLRYSSAGCRSRMATSRENRFVFSRACASWNKERGKMVAGDYTAVGFFQPPNVCSR